MLPILNPFENSGQTLVSEILYQTKTCVTATTVANPLTCAYKRLVDTTILCCHLSKENRSFRQGWGTAVHHVRLQG